MKSNTKKRGFPFRLALTLAVGSVAVGVPVDVKAISCRKPCGRWWLYTYREQWV
jgi:hypothetical protein